MLCSLQRASMSLMYKASSQLVANTHKWACRLSKALAASLMPRVKPSATRAAFNTLLNASLMSISPTTAGCCCCVWSSLQFKKSIIYLVAQNEDASSLASLLSLNWSFKYTLKRTSWAVATAKPDDSYIPVHIGHVEWISFWN